MRLGAVLAALLTAAAAAPAFAAAPYERLPAVVHVHSDLSTGDFSLEELAVMAERQGVGALLLTENYLARVDYGLPPFRALTRVSHEVRSVHGRLDEYLARVAQAQAVRPRVLLLAGVEVMPHYFWTGSPLSLEMTLHGTQKNLLVFGLDRAALARLPVIGNERPARLGLQPILDALPGLLILPGLVLLARPRTHRRRLGQAVVVLRRRAWFAGVTFCAVGIIALARAWPFAVPLHSPYVDAGVAPFQTVIDYVQARGGAVVWSLPEARDSGEQAVGPVRVTWATEPYADDLLRTARYTAFGAVYEDTTRAERPGEVWDRLLQQYAAGERTRPAWAVGESAFHDYSANKRIGPIQTVFFVRERSEAGVLEALRAGRMYALQRGRDAGLALAEFTASAGGGIAISGETLRAVRGWPLEVTLAIDATEPRGADVRLTLVRSGVVVGAWTGPTPLRVVHRETWDGQPAVFRLEARGNGARLLSNPIFVRQP
ncbi:MAG TPA: hypothetical protein VGR82_05100 [Methylomirabilota bacterium]|nr:hypothetical protein [Methylomirabilota bacterium]